MFSFLCCIVSYLQNKSTIQQTNPILSTNSNDQKIEKTYVSYEEDLKDFIKKQANIVDQKKKHSLK